MAGIVYVLCALASTSCAFLLTKGYLKNKTKLLLWSSLCFLGFAINNILLVIDLIFIDNADLSLLRIIPSVFGIIILLYGLIWETT